MNPAAGKLAQELLKKYASAVISGGGAGVKSALQGSKTLNLIGRGTPEAAARALTQLPVVGNAMSALPLGMNTVQGAARALPEVANIATQLGLGTGTILASNALAQSVITPQRQTSFGSQQYTPGRSPLTNEMAAEAILDQQRFMHQMQLIEARNAAASGAGSLSNQGGSIDMMALANQALGKQLFTPSQY